MAPIPPSLIHLVAQCRPRTFSPRCVTRTLNCTLLVLPRYCSVFSAFRFVQYGGGEANCLRRYRVWAGQGPTSYCAWPSIFVKPQRFIPVGDIRAETRQTLEIVSQGSVVITTHGEPQAAIVNFETFDAVRGAVMRLLLGRDGGQHQSNARSCPSAVRERRADWRG